MLRLFLSLSIDLPVIFRLIESFIRRWVEPGIGEDQTAASAHDRLPVDAPLVVGEQELVVDRAAVDAVYPLDPVFTAAQLVIEPCNILVSDFSFIANGIEVPGILHRAPSPYGVSNTPVVAMAGFHFELLTRPGSDSREMSLDRVPTPTLGGRQRNENQHADRSQLTRRG